MQALIIDDAAIERVRAAISHAKANPVPLSFLEANRVAVKDRLELSDRPEGFVPYAPPEPVQFDIGYMACFTVEEQKDGLYGHLSISVDDKPGAMPTASATIEIAKLYGLPVEKWASAWAEEYQPGYYAGKILCPMEGDRP